jgi:hypothetical protein
VQFNSSGSNSYGDICAGTADIYQSQQPPKTTLANALYEAACTEGERSACIKLKEQGKTVDWETYKKAVEKNKAELAERADDVKRYCGDVCVKAYVTRSRRRSGSSGDSGSSSSDSGTSSTINTPDTSTKPLKLCGGPRALCD